LVIQRNLHLTHFWAGLKYLDEINIRKEQDKSMNRDEGSYQLPHFYDYLLFAAATPGGPGPKKTAVVAKTSTTNYVTKNVI